MKKIFNLVRKHFTYVSDSKQYMQDEHWTSHADSVLLGLDFSDDCDGFALTCAELFMREGYDTSIIYCITEQGVDHLVCGVNHDNNTYIADNRYNYMYKIQNRNSYTWKYFMKLSNPGVWLTIEK